jgi:hypothetical protein
MKHVWILLLALCPAWLHAEIEFSGFLTGPGLALYSLTDTADGVSSGWLRPGATFRDCTIDRFDSARGVLVVRRAKEEVELKLRDAKTGQGRLIVLGQVRLPSETRLDGVRATLVMDQDNVLPLREGVTLHLRPSRMADGNMMYRSHFVVRQADGSEKTVMAPAVVGRPGQPFTMNVGELGYSFTP